MQVHIATMAQSHVRHQRLPLPLCRPDSQKVLFRLPSQPGLEILTPSGKWVPVPVDPVPGSSKSLPILVNVGDLLSFWTNGLLKSTVHRVVFPTASEDQPESTERLSIAFFCRMCEMLGTTLMFS